MNGKGRGPEKGYNRQAYAANYDAIFRQPTHPTQQKEPMKTNDTPAQPAHSAVPNPHPVLRDKLRAEVEAKTDRLIAAESMANSLANQIGSIEPHEHPDEQKPRAQTWLQERKNWAAEVAQLRAELAAAKLDTERLDWLASQSYYPHDHPKDGVFVVVSENVAPHGAFSLERDRDRKALRAAIDAARSQLPEIGKDQP